MIKAVVFDSFGVLYADDHERNEPLVAYAQDLRRHYKVGLLSNISSAMMDGYFSQADRNRLFDAVVLSGDVARAKPDPEIFRLICRNLGVEPEEAVMVDDSPIHCQGARSAGMQAVQYLTNRQARSELDAILAK